MKSWPELHQRLLALSQTLRGHGIVWTPFGDMGAEVRRGSRIPPGVVAEMKSLLEELRALVRATTAASGWGPLSRRARAQAAGRLHGPVAAAAGLGIGGSRRSAGNTCQFRTTRLIQVELLPRRAPWAVLHFYRRVRRPDLLRARSSAERIPAAFAASAACGSCRVCGCGATGASGGGAAGAAR